jgi:hypothetical protein
MSRQERVASNIQTGMALAGASNSSVHALHVAADALRESTKPRARLKAKDIIRYLLGHGARSWRGSQPVSNPRVLAWMPSGNLAVRLRLR